RVLSASQCGHGHSPVSGWGRVRYGKTPSASQQRGRANTIGRWYRRHLGIIGVRNPTSTRAPTSGWYLLKRETNTKVSSTFSLVVAHAGRLRWLRETGNGERAWSRRRCAPRIGVDGAPRRPNRVLKSALVRIHGTWARRVPWPSVAGCGSPGGLAPASRRLASRARAARAP